MGNFVNSITEGLSADAIWGQVTPFATIIVTVTLVAIGAYIVRKNLRAAGHLKSGRV